MSRRPRCRTFTTEQEVSITKRHLVGDPDSLNLGHLRNLPKGRRPPPGNPDLHFTQQPLRVSASPRPLHQ